MKNWKKCIAAVMAMVLLCGCTAGEQMAGSVPTEITVSTEATAVPAEPTEPTQTDPVTAPTETTPPQTQPPQTEPAETAEPATEPTEPEHIHSYSSSTVSPTCTEGGYTLHTCACGDSFTDASTEALGHDYEKKVTKPTCKADGYTAYKCGTCGKAYKSDYTDATGHSWGSWVTTREATTTSEGEKQRKCSTCGTVKTETIARIEPETWEKGDALYEPATELEAEVARLFFQYINQFRAEEGAPTLIWLDGMSQVAQYRSRQLVTNFVHDTTDEREATAYYEYGKYVDFAEAGCPELVDQNYWDDQAPEAISYYSASSRYPADDVARAMATWLRESVGHWRYVGSADNIYGAIGVTYCDGWYICTKVGAVNYG